MKTALVVAGCSDVLLHSRVLLNSAKDAGFDSSECELLIFSNSIHRPESAKLDCSRVRFFISEQFSANLFCAQTILPELCEVCNAEGYELIVFTDGFPGNQLAVKLGYRLNGSWMTDIESYRKCQKPGIKATKNIYSQNLKADLSMDKLPCCIGLANSAFEPDAVDAATQPEIIIMDVKNLPESYMSDIHIRPEPDADTLKSAKNVVVAGRGARNKSDMEFLEELAHEMDGNLGGTRALVTDGLLPHSKVVGSSGKILHPELCVTFGVSGAMPLVKGVEKSKLLISVNIDPSASIFRESDVGVCDDWKPIATELMRLIKNDKQ